MRGGGPLFLSGNLELEVNLNLILIYIHFLHPRSIFWSKIKNSEKKIVKSFAIFKKT